MQFSRDPVSTVTVRRVEPGRLWIGEQVIDRAIALDRRGVKENWQCASFADLSDAVLTPLLSESPDVVLVGSGWQSRQPPRDIVFALARRGVGIECMDTPAACRTFNILVAEDRDPLALLFLDAAN